MKAKTGSSISQSDSLPKINKPKKLEGWFHNFHKHDSTPDSFMSTLVSKAFRLLTKASVSIVGFFLDKFGKHLRNL